MSRKKNHVALFAGLGGFITAANRAGFETIYGKLFPGSSSLVESNVRFTVPYGCVGAGHDDQRRQKGAGDSERNFTKRERSTSKPAAANRTAPSCICTYHRSLQSEGQ